MRHILTLLLENQSGALSRVVGLFSQRGYNIETLNVSPTSDPTLSRLTITTTSGAQQLEQIQKQLHKIIDVLKVKKISDIKHVEREIALLKLKRSSNDDALEKLIAQVSAKIIDNSDNIIIVELTECAESIDKAIALFADAVDIIEIARSGIVGMSGSDLALLD